MKTDGPRDVLRTGNRCCNYKPRSFSNSKCCDSVALTTALSTNKIQKKIGWLWEDEYTVLFFNICMTCIVCRVWRPKVPGLFPSSWGVYGGSLLGTIRRWSLRWGGRSFRRCGFPSCRLRGIVRNRCKMCKGLESAFISTEIFRKVGRRTLFRFCDWRIKVQRQSWWCECRHLLTDLNFKLSARRMTRGNTAREKRWGREKRSGRTCNVSSGRQFETGWSFGKTDVLHSCLTRQLYKNWYSLYTITYVSGIGNYRWPEGFC